MSNLKDKTIIITGGLGLLGSAFSEHCGLAQANVVVVDLENDMADKAIESMKTKTGNQNILFKKCDIANEEEVHNLVNKLSSSFGNIDAVVNSAYPRTKNYGKGFEDVSYNDFCENVNLHLGGYFLFSKEVAKIMIKQKSGIIINIGSTYGFAAPRVEIYKDADMIGPTVEYAAIKGGIINMTIFLASYLGRYNIRVNTISPGGIFNNQPKNFLEGYCSRVVLGNRMANTDDLTGALLFLLSDESKYITGQNLVIDGGWTL